jgi:hypothetical protein
MQDNYLDAGIATIPNRNRCNWTKLYHRVLSTRGFTHRCDTRLPNYSSPTPRWVDSPHQCNGGSNHWRLLFSISVFATLRTASGMQPILSHGIELARKGEYVTDSAVLFCGAHTRHSSGAVLSHWAGERGNALCLACTQALPVPSMMASLDWLLQLVIDLAPKKR